MVVRIFVASHVWKQMYNQMDSVIVIGDSKSINQPWKKIMDSFFLPLHEESYIWLLLIYLL